MCIPCKDKKMSNYSGFYDHLPSHLQSEKHKVAVLKDEIEIPEAVESLSNFKVKKKKVKLMKKEITESIRIDLTGFLLENELSFILAPKLSSFFKKNLINYGQQAVNEFTISDRLASQIAKEAICNPHKKEIIKDLGNSSFSLTFDASSDYYGPSYLCIHVRSIKSGKIVTRLLSLSEIKGSSTGEALFEILQNVFIGSEHLLSTNLVGVSSDQGSNVCSKKDKGLTNRIIEKYEQTCGTIDLCHCFNNICKYSLKKFPLELLKLVKKISSHFGSSSLRRANFREVQKDFREDEFSDFLKALPYVSHR